MLTGVILPDSPNEYNICWLSFEVFARSKMIKLMRNNSQYEMFVGFFLLPRMHFSLLENPSRLFIIFIICLFVNSKPWNWCQKVKCFQVFSCRWAINLVYKKQQLKLVLQSILYCIHFCKSLFALITDYENKLIFWKQNVRLSIGLVSVCSWF